METRNSRAFYKGKKERETVKYNSSIPGKKNDLVRSRESQNEQLMKEFLREGAGASYKGR